jgi:hypothetical protein
MLHCILDVQIQNLRICQLVLFLCFSCDVYLLRHGCVPRPIHSGNGAADLSYDLCATVESGILTDRFLCFPRFHMPSYKSVHTSCYFSSSTHALVPQTDDHEASREVYANCSYVPCIHGAFSIPKLHKYIIRFKDTQHTPSFRTTATFSPTAYSPSAAFPSPTAYSFSAHHKTPIPAVLESRKFLVRAPSGLLQPQPL